MLKRRSVFKSNNDDFLPTSSSSMGGIDGSGRSVRMDAPLFRAAKNSSSYTKFSYCWLIGSITMITWSIRFMTFHYATTYLSCEDGTNCLLKIIPPNRTKSLKLNFMRDQIVDAKLIQVTKNGDVIPDDDIRSRARHYKHHHHHKHKIDLLQEEEDSYESYGLILHQEGKYMATIRDKEEEIALLREKLDKRKESLDKMGNEKLRLMERYGSAAATDPALMDNFEKQKRMTEERQNTESRILEERRNEVDRRKMERSFRKENEGDTKFDRKADRQSGKDEKKSAREDRKIDRGERRQGNNIEEREGNDEKRNEEETSNENQEETKNERENESISKKGEGLTRQNDESQVKETVNVEEPVKEANNAEKLANEAAKAKESANEGAKVEEPVNEAVKTVEPEGKEQGNEKRTNEIESVEETVKAEEQKGKPEEEKATTQIDDRRNQRERRNNKPDGLEGLDGLRRDEPERQTFDGLDGLKKKMQMDESRYLEEQRKFHQARTQGRRQLQERTKEYAIEDDQVREDLYIRREVEKQQSELRKLTMELVDLKRQKMKEEANVPNEGYPRLEELYPWAIWQGDGKYMIVMRKYNIGHRKRRPSSLITNIKSFADKKRERLLIRENTNIRWQGIVGIILGMFSILLCLLIGQFWEPRKIYRSNNGNHANSVRRKHVSHLNAQGPPRVPKNFPSHSTAQQSSRAYKPKSYGGYVPDTSKRY
mmetsp:Transcript_31779/g.36491  ORF Transcript_31779/g.36491 Transcript_31779/m.36491 type:complete len:713 (+) Transcript_31779:93-2231(+)